MIDQIESSNGWLIHQYPIRDHLLLLYFLTPSRLIKAFYRLPKNKSPGKPQAFYPYWVAWKTSKDALNIHSIELHEQPLVLQGLKLFVGMYLNELIFQICRHQEISEQSYQLYEELLYDKQDCNQSLLRQFEWQLLADCGYYLDYSHTCYQEEIQEERYYQFDPAMGFSEATDGIFGRHLLAILDPNCQDAQASQVFKKTLRMTIDYVLDGRVLHSRKLLRDWLTP